jgi:Lon protease-like protein
MVEIPLFPLNTVLFPGMPLRLHIFEERYKRMIQWCLSSGQPFGVVLIRRGREALGPLAEPFSIGCTAKITDLQRLGDGRMNLSGLGQERFRTLQLDRNALPYLLGAIEPYPLLHDDPEAEQQSGQQLANWLRHYLGILNQAGKEQLSPAEIPEDPVSLAYLAASLVQAPPLEKQRILSIGEASQLLSEVLALFRREIAILRALLLEQAEPKGSFSNN